MSLALYKDSQFAKLFGTVAARPIPPAVFLPFVVRDSLTIFVSFGLPSMITPMLPVSMDGYVLRASAVQFAAPAFIQIFGTSLHLLGLDLYNGPATTSIKDRLSKIRVDWLMATLARMCRVIPMFGIGGVTNNKTRAYLMQGL